MTILSRAVLTSILLAGLFHAEVQADGGIANLSDPVTIADVQVRFSDHGTWCSYWPKARPSQFLSILPSRCRFKAR